MARKQVPALALAFKGRWRIVAMDLWDKDAIDLVEPGFITFNGEEGEMRFIAVRAWLDVRYRSRDGVPVAEFSWEGIDEGDQRSGRGWATPADKGGLLGERSARRASGRPSRREGALGRNVKNPGATSSGDGRLARG